MSLRSLIIIAVFVSGCAQFDEPASALSDGYQIGDLTREAVRVQEDFCTAGDPFKRLILLKAFEEVGIAVDGKNVCEIDIVEELSGL